MTSFTKAEKAAIAAAEPEWIQVGERTFEPHHRKADNTTNVMTKFRYGNIVHKAWYCPGREGVGREKACKFWSDHGGLAPFPKDADEWLARAGELRPTAEISVRPDGKYISIVDARPGRFHGGAMTRRCPPARLAAVKRQMLAIENALNDMSRRSRNKERGDKLASVADAVTDLRACDLRKRSAATTKRR